jgi:RHS repeat-associated protein
MSHSAARLHRFPLRLIAALSAVLLVVGLAVAVASHTLRLGGSAAGGPPGRVTGMAQLAPQLVAKPGADPVTDAAKQPTCTPAMLPAAGAARAVPGQATRVAHDGAAVDVGGGAVRITTNITAESLCGTSLAPMSQGMANVTAGPRRGYRFLPHMTFAANLHITLPYDPALIPAGETAQDVKTFYYDVKHKRWMALSRVSVDQKAHTVTSLTNHFTDFANATITVPDQPGVLNNDPTTIKDIKAADPGAGINLIAPPAPSSDGSARLSYPIQLPAGRHSQTPALSLGYDSTAPNGSAGPADGWLGLGWNLSLPTVEVNTQWGVPRYDPANETETYMLGAQEMTPVANRGPAVPRTAEKVFHPRVEGTFLKIVRHGGDPKSYWWEVTEKDGTREFFGGDPTDGPTADSELTDASGNIFEWALRQTMDLAGNTVNYSYAHVQDPGVAGGTVTGTNLYPQSINYTGSGGSAGPYTVTFTRDRDLPGFTRRPDVTMSARGGFLQVTADLLKQIDVAFNGQPIRSYTLNYTTGAFNKTLLQSITQLGANGTVFSTHTFSYYNDAQDATGNYNGFSAPAQVNTGNDGVTAGLLGQGQASALSGSLTTAVGAHLYVGFNPVAPTKEGSAGAKVGFNTSSTDGVLAMVDLNGDELPDKVFRQDGQTFFRLNTTKPGDQVTFSDQAFPLPTLPAISHSSSSMFSVGAEAYFAANVFANQAETTTTSDTYFQDVNGDGLLDLVANGQVLFNHLDASGIPTFTANSADTPVPIGGGTVDTSSMAPPPTQSSTNDPLVDTLRVWTAPFDGTVNISGDVALIQDTSPARAQYTAADGVRVAIQQNGTELWNTTIGPDDSTPHTPAGVTGLTVQRGDRFYFRSQSVDDGKYDQVSWDPVIAYQNVAPTTDVNGLDVYTYQASKDFTLAGRPGAIVTAPLTGTVHLAGTFHKAAPTTDDVTVEVLQNGKQVFSQTVPAAQTGDVPVSQDIQVNQGDTIALREKIDSPIDVTKLSWDPQLYYTSSPSGNVTDGNGKPLIQLHPAYDTDLYPADDLNGAPQQAWTVPTTGTVHVSPMLAVASGANGTVTFTVKRQGGLVFKQPVTITDGAVPDPSFDLPVTAGDQLYFDYSAADPALAAQITSESVQVTYSGQSPVTVPSALHSATAPGVLPETYRGWAYVGYNGDGDRATQPIVESDLTQAFSSTSQYDPRTAKAYPFTPSPQDGEWLGPNSGIWVQAGSVSSSRLGSPNLSAAAGSQPAGATAPARVSQASQTAVGGGVSLLSGSADSGSTTSDVDYLDMNGSGFPAVVSNGHIQYPDQTGALEPAAQAVPGFTNARSSNASSANVGVGASPAHFSADSRAQVDDPGHAPEDNTTGSQMVQLGLSGSLGKGESHPQSDLVDLNGDGLPDLVTEQSGQLMVSLNLGYSFAPPEPWGAGQLGDGASENGSIGASLGFNDGVYGFAGGVSLSKNKSETSEQLISMTGSGLPDRVINTPSGLQVAFNTGTGFAPPVPWPGAPDGACADNTSAGLAGIDWNTARICNGDTSLGAGVYFTVGIPLCLAACYVILNPGVDSSQTMGREEGMLRDVNGSGAPSYVSSTSDGQLTVSLNNVGRTNLLKSVTRPLGATITLDYQLTGNTTDQPAQRWVMSKVTVDPGHPAGAVTQATSYQYSGGTYNRLERMFYGFAAVTENILDTTNGDAVYRTTIRDYDASSYYTQGLLLRTRVLDAAGHLFTDARQTYVLRDVTTGAEPADPNSTTATEFPMQVRTDTASYEGGPTAQKTTFTTQHFDALGNIDQTFQVGDPSPRNDVTTTISYASCPDTYVMGTPVSSVTTGGGTVMRHSEQTVDCATGNVTEERQFLADGTAAVTDMTYDQDGNLATITNPANLNGQRYEVSYQYDPTVATYVTQTTDSFGLTSTATPDLRFGTSQSQTDANGNTTSDTFDEFGRMTTATGPYQQGTGTATITFEYHPDGDIPWAITHNADVFRGPGATIDTVTFIDGLERNLQTKKTATIFTGASSAPQDVMVVSGQVTFDFLGRDIATTYPVTEPLGTPGVYNTSVDPQPPTQFTYDVLDRQTSITQPDGTTTRSTYGFGPDRSGTTQFMTTATDANGHVKVTFRDSRDELTAAEQFHNGTPAWTSYVYDPLKELVKVTDDHGNVTTQAYDNLGRMVALGNPDTGLTQIVLDLASNQIARITPRLRAKGEQISYAYDFGRLIKTSYPDNPGNNVTYTYGAPGAPDNGAGRIVKTTDASGVLVDSYGKLGEVTKEVRTLNTVIGVFHPVYTTQYAYDTFGRLQQMIYPDGEVLIYHYDSGGLVNQVTGVKGPNTYTYVSRLEYDKFGSKAFIDYGNGVTTTYAYNPLSRRLATMQSAPAGGSDFQNISYTYDSVGNLTALANNVAVEPNDQLGGPTSQQFTYDDLDRLTGATGTYQFNRFQANQYSLSLSYDSIDNVTAKQQVNQIVGPSGEKFTIPDTTYTFNYAYNGPQPNAPTKIGNTNYTYDANGNQAGFKTGLLNVPQRTIRYDDENRIQSISTDGLEADYVYDDAGDRVIKRGPDGETAYVNQYFTVRNGLIATKQIIVGGTLVASKLVAHDQRLYEDDQLFFHPDQVGSVNYVTGTHGEVLEHLEYFPTGETWAQEAFGDAVGNTYQFAGKQLDPESGLYYFGARYYDPRTGIFETPDPALVHRLANLPEDPSTPTTLDTFAAGFLNLYSYADDEPLTVTDPDGLQGRTDLSTQLLRGAAIKEGFANGLNLADRDDLVQFNRAVGRAFQQLALNLFGNSAFGQPAQENTTPVTSSVKAWLYGGSGAVIPDWIGGVQPVLPNGTPVGPVFPDSAYAEVKAVNRPGLFGGLGLGYSNGQIFGLVWNAGFTAAAKSSTAKGVLLFLTTSNTDISSSVLWLATRLNVAVWQAKAYSVADPDPTNLSGVKIGFGAATLLNPSVYIKGTDPTQFPAQLAAAAHDNPLPKGTGEGVLVTSRPQPAGNPDPQILDDPQQGQP